MTGKRSAVRALAANESELELKSLASASRFTSSYATRKQDTAKLNIFIAAKYKKFLAEVMQPLNIVFQT